MTHLHIALNENLTDQRLESLCKGRVGNIALVLVEFARREKPARRNKHLVQLVHQRGFADARITGHKHELWPTLRHDPIEGCEQSVNLALAPIQLFGNQQPVWYVLFAKRKLINPAPRFPFIKTAPKIARSTGRCLIALLSRLCEQLHDDVRNRARNTNQPRTWRHWL